MIDTFFIRDCWFCLSILAVSTMRLAEFRDFGTAVWVLIASRPANRWFIYISPFASEWIVIEGKTCCWWCYTAEGFGSHQYSSQNCWMWETYCGLCANDSLSDGEESYKPTRAIISSLSANQSTDAFLEQRGSKMHHRLNDQLMLAFIAYFLILLLYFVVRLIYVDPRWRYLEYWLQHLVISRNLIWLPVEYNKWVTFHNASLNI